MKGKAIFYSDEIKIFIKENQHGKSRQELTEILNNKFKTNYSVENIKRYCNRNGLYNGNTGQFKKGIIPLNKGAKMPEHIYERCANTMFKKGNSINIVTVGTERISKDGYIEIKVEQPNKWELKHKHIFEKEYGRVPKGHCIIFLDQNKQNVDIKNLKLIKRSELLVMNRRGMFFKEKVLNETSSNLAKLIVKINEAKASKNNKKSDAGGKRNE